MKTFDELISLAKKGKKKFVAVADIEEEVLLALEEARKNIGVKGILVGNVKAVEEIAKRNNIDLSDYEIVDEGDREEALRRSIALVREKKADILMKGLIHSSTFLKAVLDKDKGLVQG
ncbi:MAG: phosphate butyryltransferase, partial [bacterium]